MRHSDFYKITQMLAKDHKISIEEGERWAADIKTRVLFYRKEDVLNLEEDHLLGLLLHEVAHIHYTTDSPPHATEPELFHNIMNVLEDISIEHLISQDYPNAEEVLEITMQDIMNTLLEMLPKLQDVTRYEKSLLYATLKFKGRGYKTAIHEYEKVGTTIGELMIKNTEIIFNRKKTADMCPLGQEIMDILLKEYGNPTPQEKKRMEDKNKGEGRGSKENAGQEGANKTLKEKAIEAIKAGRGFDTKAVIDKSVKQIENLVERGPAVGVAIRKILKKNNATEYEGHFRSGKLPTKRLVKIRTIRDKRPFSRKVRKTNRSYAFAVCADVSGSMQGPKMNYALSAELMVAEALRIAGVQRTIHIFGNENVMINKIGKQQVRWEEIANKHVLLRAGGGTDIDLTMEASRLELMKTTAERKIMIILTDGESNERKVEEEYRKAKANGIECIGITIGDGDMLSRVFKEERNIHIKSGEQAKAIGEAFIEILGRTIKEYKHE